MTIVDNQRHTPFRLHLFLPPFPPFFASPPSPPCFLQSHNLGEGVHGSLIDLIDVRPQVVTAAEVTAGNSLFHVVVDSDEIATRLVRHLNQEKLGAARKLLELEFEIWYK